MADSDGFRADVVSNEPGVASQSSNSFSKITKKINMHSVLVPGFRYSSTAPHVVFSQEDRESGIGFRSDTMDRTVDEETGDFVVEDFSKMYAGEMSQDNNVARDFSEDFDETLPDRHPEPGSWFASEDQPSKDLDGEYGYDTPANMLQNQTFSAVHEASEVSAKAQTAPISPSVVAALTQTDNPTIQGQVKYRNGLKLERTGPTLAAVLSKTNSQSRNEQVNYENGFNLPGIDTSSAATLTQTNDLSRYGRVKYENGFDRPWTDTHGDLHPLQSEAIARSEREPITAESQLNATLAESRFATNETVTNNVAKD